MTKEKSENVPKMTLLGYYETLPEASYPKTDFVNKVAKEIGVSNATVHNWIHGKTKPMNHEHILKLCSITGLKENELWKK